MSSREEIINQFYTDICDEDLRLMNSKHSRVEFLTTIKYISEFLSETSRILEIGAGTGRYSLYYAEQGYDVTAIEYVESNLAVLKSKIKEGMRIDARQGDAVDLSDIKDDSFDVTLVLGPLYHLYDRDEQEKAIAEAIRVTKKNGIVAIAYLSSDSIILDWALRDHHMVDGKNKDFDEHYKIINYPGGIFAAFYISEFKEMMEKFPVVQIKNIATDGVAIHMREVIDELSEEEFSAWMEYHLLSCERKELQGYSNHLLYICRKKQIEK